MKSAHHNSTRALTAADIFSGCGGLTLGLKQAGFQVVGAVEMDELAVVTYACNHPEVHLWPQRIEEVTPDEMLAKFRLEPGDLDLLAGCPPCQGFSAMTTLNGKHGTNDPRNDLVFEFLRFVRGLQPKAIMMENVPGLARDERMTRVLGELRELGYEGEPHVLDAADYAVPQRRKRMILLASRSGPVAYARPARSVRTVRTALAGVSTWTLQRNRLHRLPEKRSPKVAELIRSIPKNGGSRTDLPPDDQLQCHRDCDGFHDVYGRMRWDAVAPTITGGCCNPSKGRFLHPEEDRCISLREAALLQTFPVRYYFPPTAGKFAVAQMIGNALPPEFIRRHALAVRSHLQSVSAKA